jgi:cystathionine gamma-lyase
MRFSTKAIHVGQEPDPTTGAVNVPIYLTSTFSQRTQDRYVYGRSANPTRHALEANLAALEEGRHGLAFGSGMAAITTILLGLLERGDHVVASDDVYGGTYRLFVRVFAKYGLEVTWVDASDLDAVDAALRDDTKLLWLESPTNPLMKIVDLEGAAKRARERGTVTVVDNTFASPYLQQPIPLGCDVVVHSTTKYLGGHADVIGGALVTRQDALHERLAFAQNAVGGIPSPFDCWLVLRGVKTLAVRMDRHCANAMAVAEHLADHPKVRRVHYPGLPDHPLHDVAKRQMRAFGGMMSFVLADGVDPLPFLKRLRFVVMAESLGGVESLAEHPASMTHATVPREERERRGIEDGLIRLSVGIEDADDLIEDLDRALG